MRFTPLLLITSGLFVVLSCGFQENNRDSPAKDVTEIQFTKAVLYTIDSSIYNAEDTIWDFLDGTPAYQYAFGGASFIDSTGYAIHARFNKYDLSANEILKLKSEFIVKFCDEVTTSCEKTYRDVIVFKDSLDKMVGQAQICFSCSDVVVYPYDKFNCVGESGLNFTKFKSFVESIKHE